MVLKLFDNAFLNYLVAHRTDDSGRLPALGDMAKELDVSTSKLREQMEVIRALGLIEVRPNKGIRFTGVNIAPAIRLIVQIGIALDRTLFRHITALRNHIEAAFWDEAVGTLTDTDRDELRALVESAREQLEPTSPQHAIHIPHAEHRSFHLKIFVRLDNPFVTGLLQAYWDAYESVELNTYADLNHWKEAWDYHERILDLINADQIEASRQAFIEHTKLLRWQHERSGVLQTTP